MTQLAPREANMKLQYSFVQHLKDFHTQNKLKKATLNIIVGQLPAKEIRGLRAIFGELDRNGDGRVSPEEVRATLERSGLRKSNSDVEAIMVSLDSSSTGMIDWTEFLAAALDHPKYLTRESCWTAFNVFDLDGDGKISQEELERVLFDGSKYGHVRSRKNTEDLLQEINAGDDGTINFEQFMDVMHTSYKSNHCDCWLEALAQVEEQFARSPALLGGA